MASLSDILTSLQNGVNAMQLVATLIAKGIPTESSGQIAVDTLVQTGFVRVLGVSVLSGSTHGGLYDAATLAAAASNTQLYDVFPIVNFFPLNIPFKNGLVFKPGTSQKVAIFYTRT